MTSYYKATRQDGTDFRTGTIDYASALTTGEIVSHPDSQRMVPDDAGTYLSVSVEPAETLIGGSWPCRLFQVEPVGETLDGLGASKYKRACLSLRVLGELPAWQALGPNGGRVAAIIDRAARLTPEEAKRRDVAWDAARDAAWDAAWDVAWDAARCAALDVSWDAARDAARSAALAAAWDAARSAARSAARAGAWDAARAGAWHAASAETVRDLITDEQYQALAGPWLSVIGEA